MKQGGYGGMPFWEIVSAMREAAPAGQRHLDEASLRVLGELTRSLIAARAGAIEEHARFLAIGQRELCLPEAQLEAWLDKATILVTGGTGCIGSALMQQLTARSPSRVVSVSRGVTEAGPRVPGAEYLYADIRDRRALDRVLAGVRPDVVFHLAAQRSPGLAEVEVHRTVSTNVLGTRNLLACAAEAGVPHVVCASTGKALRPYSPDVYAASKRAAEWVASGVAAGSEMICATARFTHVLDNSLIYQRLLTWARGGVIRLHSPDISFYVQSALESAQLLLLAGLGSRPREFRVHAITDLGWPISLLDLVLGVLAQTGSSAPIYISGYDPGYEEVPFPGLYDPATAGEVSPLLNALEAAAGSDSPCPMVDAFRLEMAPDLRAAKLLAALDEICVRTQDPDAVRDRLDELSWSLLEATLHAAPRQALARMAALADPHQDALNSDHRRILEVIRDVAAAEPASSAPAQSEPLPTASTA